MLRKEKKNQRVSIKEVVSEFFLGDVETTIDLFEGNAEKVGSPIVTEDEEYIVQVHVSGGTIVQLKTGRFTKEEASKEVPFAIQYCQEEFGKVLAWNWIGEENILHTPHSHEPPRKSLKDRFLNYFFDLEE